MADVSDVETALVTAALDALYPAGINQPSRFGSPVRVFRGAPATATLERDLAKGVSNLNVFSVPDTTRNTTRWSPIQEVAAGLPTLSAENDGVSVSFSGVAGAGQVSGIIADEQAFVYRGNSNDTPALVTAVLAAAIGAIRPCLLSGSTLTIPGAYRLISRVVADGTSSREVSRQEQSFCIGIWCSNPECRDLIAGQIHSSLCETAFLPFRDETCGRLRYRSTSSFDTYQSFQVYRRDIVFDVEYSTFVVVPAPSMLFGDLTWSGATIYI